MTRKLFTSFVCCLIAGASALISASEFCSNVEERKLRGIDPEGRLCEDFGHPCCPDLCSISFSTTQGKGVGFNKGYSSVGLIRSIPWHPAPHSFSFVEADVHLFNDWKWAGNAGVGVRAISNNQQTVYGANLFYDVRQARSFLHQIGLGLEMLGECYHLSANGYFPLYQRYHDVSSTETFTYPDGFFISYKLRQLAMTGADILLSTRNLDMLGCSCYGLDVGLGGYFYRREFGKSITGVRVSAELSNRDNIALDAEASYDSYFKGRLLIGLSVSIPYGPATSPCAKKGPYPSYCGEPIRRQKIIAQSKRYLVSEQNF